MMHKRIPETKENKQMPIPTYIVELIRPPSEMMREGISTPPTTEANLAIVIFRPNANPSSLPLNHEEIIVDYETDMHSPPRPNITRPVSIVA